MISLKYNQQDATFSRSVYSYKLLNMFQAVPLPTIRSTKLYMQHQGLSTQCCCLMLLGMRWNYVPSYRDILAMHRHMNVRFLRLESSCIWVSRVFIHKHSCKLIFCGGSSRFSISTLFHLRRKVT
jgi:hypothetical protein